MTNMTLIIIAIVVALIVIIALVTFIAKKGGNKGSSAQVNNQVYVGNVPYRVREAELKDYFSNYGNVRQARIVKNVRTGRSKGFAFVTFSNAQSANKALEANGQDLQGRTMVVRIAKPPKQAS